MSIKNFNKEVLETTRNIQRSDWDDLLEEFTAEGHTLFWDEVDVPRQKAAQGAKRLNTLCEGQGIDKVFHSGYHAIKKKSFIRLRPAQEVKDLKALGQKGDDSDPVEVEKAIEEEPDVDFT